MQRKNGVIYQSNYMKVVIKWTLLFVRVMSKTMWV